MTYLRGPAEAAEAEWTLGAAMALAYPAVARAAGLDGGGDLGCAVDHLRFARPGGSRVAGGSAGVAGGAGRKGAAGEGGGGGLVEGGGVAAGGGAAGGRRMSRGAGAAAAAAAAAALLGLLAAAAEADKAWRRVRGGGGQGPFGHRRGGSRGSFSIGAG